MYLKKKKMTPLFIFRYCETPTTFKLQNLWNLTLHLIHIWKTWLTSAPCKEIGVISDLHIYGKECEV